MAERTVDRRSHLVVAGTARPEPFTSPAAGGSKFRTRPADRNAHGRALQRQLERISAELERRQALGTPNGIEATRGFYLEFESPPGFLLKLKSLEYSPSGIQLATTRRDGDREFATVFVPQGGIAFFVKRVEKYLTELDSRSQQPKNRTLVESIANVRLAVIESFWTDPMEQLPPRESVVWMEAWLRGSPDEVVERFASIARVAKIEIGDEQQTFPDRTVVLIRASLRQLAATLGVLDVLAELRRVRRVGSFFSRLGKREQAAWVNELLTRLQFPTATAVAVTVLDSGVHRGHPLLTPLLDAADVHAWRPNWGGHDHHGHGTEMAGVAAYGDLAAALVSPGPITLSHRLESVKIIPPAGANPEHLYGRITADGVSFVEIQAPERPRVFSMSIGTDASDRGEPTAWSAELDKLASGAEGDERRLFFVSAGNVGPGAGRNYPDQNRTTSILDPGQAWNALTVGAYTEFTEIDEPSYAGWTCVAPRGSLGPTSTTSFVWLPRWPIKPDIVMEGGNMAISPKRTEADFPDSLSVLTTYFRDERMFTSSGDTSAATAAAARYAAIVRAQYPSLWPESVRALLVDSAEWTAPMRRELNAARDTKALEFSLRSFGFGVPDLEQALWSAGNSLTLIAQDELQPFTEDRSKEMNLHKLPWPTAELEQLGETTVELRVTLSYFVEPNPARRGWKDRHRYASHGLRFAVQKPLESVSSLRKRVNKDAREEEEAVEVEGDSDGWLLKPNLRGKGSLHHDRWRGIATELARRNHIAIYPTIGWWRERRTLGRSESKARYALVVTIRTPSTAIDIYQPVAAQVGVAIPVAT